jgi:two-component system, OmpR family, sensor histidine kinase PrrB
MTGRLSLRARVTLVATLAVALVLGISGVIIVATFASHERSSLDRDLEQRTPAREFRLPRPPPGVERGPPGPPPALSEGSGSFVRIVAGKRVLTQAGDVPEAGFPVPEGDGFDTVHAAGRDWRTLTIVPRGPVGRAGDARLQVAQDLSPVEERIGDLRLRVLVIALIGVVMAALLAWWLAGPALRPLTRLRGGVARVSSTRDLSQRLPAGGGGEEVDSLAEGVNAMLARLQRSTGETEDALEATRRFAADVGHELRTPLTSIRANFDVLARNPSMPDADRRPILTELAAEQGQLVALLDSLQALARGDAGAALPREEVDFAECVDAGIEAARRRHPEARIELDAPPASQPLTGWPDGLRLLVDNLLENAVRHGGRDVRATVAESDGGIRFTVDDDGPGVPPSERERIFERFARGMSSSAAGSGLGLALVRQQAVLHGGSVEVGDSTLGGARFTVFLPMDDTEP